MQLPFIRTWLITLGFLCVLIPAVSGGAESPVPVAPLKVSVTPTEIRFAWTIQPAASVGIRELPLQTQSDPAKDAATVWTGQSTSSSASIARFDGNRDRLFAKFALFDAASGKTIGDPQCVTDFRALPVREHSLKRPTGKKGLGCITDLSDCKPLGVQHAKEDIDIAGLLDWSNPSPTLTFDFEGRKVGLHPHAVQALDSRIKGMSDLGINVIGCLLNSVPRNADQKSPLIHPRTDPAQVPMGLAAFNTATADGVFYYRAIVHWLIERYTQPDEAHGRMTSLIIGNELQSHWTWYNMGEARQDEVIRDYSTALRIADLAARSVHRDFHIYISMEHHWSLRGESEDPLREIAGMDLIHGIAEISRHEGNFPWHVAFHPYPENLFEPRFWNDTTAPFRLDAPRITFKNLEVLAEFLRQPEYLYEGRPRLIALTEQGFHCSNKPDSAEVQAAAYAYAFKRIEAIPGIELFIYHRHVDHPKEGGLNLGLREYDPSKPGGMGRQRLIWEVFQKAGTPKEDAAFAFALPIVGRKDWTDLIASHIEKSRPGGTAPSSDVVFDFVAERRTAGVTNTLALELKRVTKSAGWLATALQQHPNATGASHVEWHVKLPAAQAGKRLVLSTTALLNHPESHGIHFAIQIEGKKQWEKTAAPMESAPVELDLTDSASHEITVDFEVNPIHGSQYAWATWIEPRIVWKSITPN